MSIWQDNCALLAQILRHEARQNPALQRRLAIVEVLWERGFMPWQALVESVEAKLEPGIFGASPRKRLWNDLHWLRDAGVAIGYSRGRGTTGYFLRVASLSEPIRTAFEQIGRELDFEHLERLKKVPGWRKIEAMFGMIEFAYDVSAAGRRSLERGE